MPSLSIRELYCLGMGLVLTSGSAWSIAQTKAEEKSEFNHDIRCLIRNERPQWNRTSEAVVSGTVENLTDGPLALDVDPVFYIMSRTSSDMGDKFWAPADLLRDSPITTEKHAIGADKKAEGIEPRPIRLQFKNKGDKVDFRIDARHLLWAKVISSVWPSSRLYSTVKSDEYDLQLVLETDKGRVESPKVKISIDASKAPKH